MARNTRHVQAWGGLSLNDYYDRQNTDALSALINEQRGTQYQMTSDGKLRLNRTLQVARRLRCSGSVYQGYETAIFESSYNRYADQNKVKDGLQVNGDLVIDGDVYVGEDWQDGYDFSSTALSTKDASFTDKGTAFACEYLDIFGDLYIRGKVIIGEAPLAIAYHMMPTGQLRIPKDLYVKSAQIGNTLLIGYDSYSLGVTNPSGIPMAMNVLPDYSGVKINAPTIIEGDLYIMEDAQHGDTSAVTTITTIGTLTDNGSYYSQNTLVFNDVVYITGNVFYGTDRLPYPNVQKYAPVYIGSQDLVLGAVKPRHLDLSECNQKIGVGTYEPTHTLDVKGDLAATVIYEDGQSLSDKYILKEGAIFSVNIDASNVVSGVLHTDRVPSITNDKIVSMDASKITNLVQDAQIHSVKTTKLLGLISTSNLDGMIGDDQIAGMSSSKLIGTVQDSQIASLSTSKLIGTVSDSQIAGMSATKLIGNVLDSQLTSISASKLSGLVQDAQIQDLSSSKLTGTIATALIPNLDANKITAGTLDINRVPSIPASKLSATTGSGNVVLSAAPTFTGAVNMSTASLTVSNVNVIGTYTTVNTVTTVTNQTIVNNAGTGPALSVSQSGTNTVAEFIDAESGTALFIANTGLVGIGTSTVTTKLQMYGGTIKTEYDQLFATSTNLLTMNNNNTSNVYNSGQKQVIEFGGKATSAFASAGNTRLINQPQNVNGTSDFAIEVRSAGTYNERLRIKADGNVGIGTTTPLQKLHVVGDVLATNFVGIGTQLTGITTAQIGGLAASATTDTTNATNITTGTLDIARIADLSLTGAKLANLTITGGKLANTTITAAQIANTTITATQLANLTVTGAKIAAATITADKMATGVLANVDSWTDAGTSVYTLGASVGIGTATPQTALHVVGAVSIDSSNALSFRTYGGGWYMYDTTWIRSTGNKSIYHNSGIMRTDGTLQVGSSGATLNVPSGGNFSYRTNVLFANTTGYVGIGNSAPATKLDVSGDVIAGTYISRASSTTEGGEIQLQSPTSTTGIWVIDSQSTDLRIFNSLGGTLTNNVYIGATGNMNVKGTTTVDQLTLNGSWGTNNLKQYNADGSGSDFTNYNLQLQCHWGFGIADYAGTTRITMDARTGDMRTKGCLASSLPPITTWGIPHATARVAKLYSVDGGGTQLNINNQVTSLSGTSTAAIAATGASKRDLDIAIITNATQINLDVHNSILSNPAENNTFYHVRFWVDWGIIDAGYNSITGGMMSITLAHDDGCKVFINNGLAYANTTSQTSSMFIHPFSRRMSVEMFCFNASGAQALSFTIKPMFWYFV